MDVDKGLAGKMLFKLILEGKEWKGKVVFGFLHTYLYIHVHSHTYESTKIAMWICWIVLYPCDTS